jgi:hypothetical protein
MDFFGRGGGIQDFIQSLMGDITNQPQAAPAPAPSPAPSFGMPFRGGPPPDPVQDIVAQSIQALGPNAATEGTAPTQLIGVPDKGVVPATDSTSGNLFAGQGAGGFGQGSIGTQGDTYESYDKPGQGRSSSVFK